MTPHKTCNTEKNGTDAGLLILGEDRVSFVAIDLFCRVTRSNYRTLYLWVVRPCLCTL